MTTLSTEAGSAHSVVDGVEVEASGARVTRHNPASPADVVGVLHCADAATVDAAVDAAARAADAWRVLKPLQRAEPLLRLAEAIESDAAELSQLLTAEEGKTLAESRGEIAQAAATFALHAELARHPDGQVIPSEFPDVSITTKHVPVGVVAAVTPWNFPAVIPAWKLAPALIAGNTVVWKPASYTSLLASRLATLMTEAGVPAGVCNLLVGDGQIGARLVGDERVNAVTFTGSEQTGGKVAMACAPRRARCQLELGGHSPAVIFADADLEHAAACVVNGFAGGSGQKCTATRRVLVGRAVAEPFLAAVSERVAALKVGDPTDPASDLGPLVSADAADAVRAEIERALTQGARLIAASETPDGDGHYVAPTVLASEDPGLTICREEVFGPVTTVMTFSDREQAWEMANATRFGLAAAVHTRDLRTAHEAAERLQAGIIKINAPTTGSEIHAPFGGTKSSSASGYREQGYAAREFFTESRTVYTCAPE